MPQAGSSHSRHCAPCPHLPLTPHHWLQYTCRVVGSMKVLPRKQTCQNTKHSSGISLVDRFVHIRSADMTLHC